MLSIVIVGFLIGACTANFEKLLPDASICGYQNINELKQNYVSLYEFPWMVHVKLTYLDLEYEFAERCSGVLISERYVLTNAYCGSDAVKVILGEYQTNESRTCHGSICTEPKKEIKIEEFIRDGKRENGPYDFGLLRLQEKVTFSDFIKPICLNFNEKKLSKELIVSGWGASNSHGVVKKRMEYKVIPDEICYQEEQFLKNNVELANVSFICSISKNTNKESACGGDHGGPFMYKSDSNQWFAEGVIIEVMYDEDDTNHFNTCSKERPINGIRITDNVIEWILSSIRS
ncbi:hypothetical protein RN001_004064 [Aquatica leii]|uniref:Peptidase S1 domain-containing protein n=1 Tax=Aquatica leii TaxID=1421715 RepID=A0AAN7QPF5_9COLE|nr:hypothetical protein RN001_004064 [Aquatica leii]